MGRASLAFGIGHAEGKTKVLVVVLRSDVLGGALLVVWGFVRIGLDGGSYQTTDQNNPASTAVQWFFLHTTNSIYERAFLEATVFSDCSNCLCEP
jgi:hypothetical protein